MDDRARLRADDYKEAVMCSACRGTLFRTEFGEGALFPTNAPGTPPALGGADGPRIQEPVTCVSCEARLEPTVQVPHRSTREAG
jgi:hypothetical protein